MIDHDEHDRDDAAAGADMDAAIADALAAVERGEGRPGEREHVAPRPGTKAAEGRPAAHGELEARVRGLEEQLRAAQAELREEHDRLLRVAADADNARKRHQRERDEILKYGVERLAKEILPVLDNLERALAAMGRDDPLAAGVQMTLRMLQDGLGRFGVKGFDAKGELFDPRVHEALMTVATGEAQAGTVLDEQQRGYFLHDRLLRPAAVVVATAPTDGAGEAGGTGRESH